MRYSRLIYLTALAIQRPSLYKIVPRHLPIAPPTLTRSIFTSRPVLSKRDYYEVLGVSKSSTDSEIKQAYFKLAKQFHPDKNTEDPRAKEKFVEIGNAYEVLSSKEKRQQYDLMGHHDQGLGGSGFSYQDFQGAEQQFHTFTEDFQDIINQFMGGGGSTGRGTQTSYTLALTFMEAVQGCTKQVPHSFLAECETCEGRGADNKYGFTTCRFCKGSGRRGIQLGPIRLQETCDGCGGVGRVPKRMCLDCKGTGRVNEHRELSLRVPAGVLHGQSTVITDPVSRVKIVLRFNVHDSRDFRRDGDDVHSDVLVHMVQAVFGGNIRVLGLNGMMDVSVPSGVQSHHKIRLTGRGIPRINGTGQGDHYLHVKIVIPKDLTEAQHQNLLNFAKSLDPEDIHGEYKERDYSSIFAKLKRKVKGK